MTAPLPRKSQELIELFNALFAPTHRTVLIAGPGEPLYRPAGDERCYHEVIFAHGFASSALHETAHWCIAGGRRRELTDYGYWYRPDGRNVAEQIEFQEVEVKPQALEWLFSVAADVPFFVSLDNLAGAPTDLDPFRRRIRDQALHYWHGAMPERAGRFLEGLYELYGSRASAESFWRRVSDADILPH